MIETEKKTDSVLNERPPVIAVMGHIDHGKSKLLDYIRKTNVVEKEAGGITQHTSAYEVIHGGKKITFLDTPGHAAFTTMRERGAKIADIAILVVSAEEGVKAQTLEALESAKTQEIPFVIAINKIDKPTAEVEKTKQSLAEAGVFVEGYGGNIPFALISAKEGTGVNELLDLLLLVAEMEELRGNSSALAKGFVLEAHLNQKSGIAGVLIIKDGTLRAGDFIVIGREVTKIKRLTNFLNEPVNELTFSAPVKIFGFTKLPVIGSLFHAFPDKKGAEEFALTRPKEVCQKILACSKNEGEINLPVVIKADVAGTLEAVQKELAKLTVEKVNLEIIASGVGIITENDVRLVNAFSHAKIIGFRVTIDKGAQTLAEKSEVSIQTSDIIYKLSEWLEEEMKKIAPKQTIEETAGRAKVLKIFNQEKNKQIIGASVVTGKINKNKEVKIFRRETLIGHGRLLGLQLQKIKTNEVLAGSQFGAEVDAKIEIAPGDYLETFEIVVK